LLGATGTGQEGHAAPTRSRGLTGLAAQAQTPEAISTLNGQFSSAPVEFLEAAALGECPQANGVDRPEIDRWPSNEVLGSRDILDRQPSA
jgi:hypothetical protein